MISAGQKVVLNNKVHSLKLQIDAEIIGGLVIEVGEKTLDLSISSKLTKMNNLLSQAV
jgi:F-type H+-transporting ATPase subunit O